MADSCGRDRTVDVLEVSTQSERIMTLHQWATYFALPSAERPRILNVTIAIIMCVQEGRD